MDTIWIISYFVLMIFTFISLLISLYILFFFRKLSRNIGRSELIKILTGIAEVEKQNSENIKTINKTIADIKRSDLKHIQKVSLTRFNPFSEMGGDHSFSLAVLDGYLTGFILTGLHTRDRTRVYVKKVEKGKCGQELSKEEKSILEK